MGHIGHPSSHGLIYPSIIYNEITTQTWTLAHCTILQYGLPLLTALAVLAIMYTHISTLSGSSMLARLFIVCQLYPPRDLVMNYDSGSGLDHKGPIARMFDVAKGDVYMPPLGTTKIPSGYFSEKS